MNVFDGDVGTADMARCCTLVNGAAVRASARSLPSPHH